MATLAELWGTPSAGPNLSGLNPDLADRLAQASNAYQEKYGKPLPITSGVRTTEQQAALAAGGNKYPVASIYGLRRPDSNIRTARFTITVC